VGLGAPGHADSVAGGIDIGHFKAAGLGEAQPSGVNGGKEHPVAGGGNRLEQARNLGGAEDGGEAGFLAGERQMLDDPVLLGVVP
jgi:hypothetical protein